MQLGIARCCRSSPGVGRCKCVAKELVPPRGDHQPRRAEEDLYSSKSVERLLNTAHNTFGQGAEVTDVSNEQLFDIENKNRNKKNADFPVGDQEKDENSRTSVMDETQQEGFEPENVMCQGVQKCVSIKSKIE